MDYVLLAVGIIVEFIVCIYFYIEEIKAQMFPRIGFCDNDISLDKIKLEKYKREGKLSVDC